MSSDFILAGDIGGTKTHLAIFSKKAGVDKPVADEKYQSAQFRSLDEVISKFLDTAKCKPRCAVFAVAGPVVCGKAKITNLPWFLDEKKLKKKFSFSTIRLINDLVGIAASVPFLKQSDMQTINKGKVCKKGTIAVVAPGTGLGISYLFWNGGKFIAHPSEGGHAGFSPENRLQSGLFRYLLSKNGAVSCENVCSGPGIRNIYEYLKTIDYAKDPKEISSAIETAIDPSPVITQSALKSSNAALSVKTIETFISILGKIAGNIALTFFAIGGLYLSGGIPKIVLPFLKEKGFMESFMGKGPISTILSKIPVKVIIHTNPALIGSVRMIMDA